MGAYWICLPGQGRGIIRRRASRLRVEVPRTTTVAGGSGWQELLKQLEEELRALDPDAVLAPLSVDADGLPRFRARLSPAARKPGRRLLREYERRAIAICEMCGHEGRVYAGPVLRVRCPSCCE